VTKMILNSADEFIFGGGGGGDTYAAVSGAGLAWPNFFFG